MSITWGQYQDQIRRSILNDIGVSNWTPEQIYDYIGWALDRFAEHTALVKQHTYDDDTYDMLTATEFDMPLDMIDDVEATVMLKATLVGGTEFYFDPADVTQGLSPYVSKTAVFWEMPSGKLNIDKALGAGATLTLSYYAYYGIPSFDNDGTILMIPRWAHKPIATLVGAYALENYAVQSATIDRWKDNSDSGNPEHNALRAQQEWLIKQYEYEIARHPRQDRTNFFRSYEAWQT